MVRLAFGKSVCLFLTLGIVVNGTAALAENTGKGARAPADEQITLSEDQVVKVLKRLKSINAELYAARAAREYRDMDVVPILVRVARDESEDRDMRWAAMAWLGKTQDPRAVPVLRNVLDTTLQSLSEPRVTEDFVAVLRGAILGLGYTGTDEALDLLAEMLLPEYWQIGGRPLAPQEPQAVDPVFDLRKAALSAIECSGTDRAIEMLATGRGIPPDFHRGLDSYLDEAIFHKAGVRTAEDDPNEPEEAKKARYRQIREKVYAQYGKQNGDRPGAASGSRSPQ